MTHYEFITRDKTTTNQNYGNYESIMALRNIMALRDQNP